jgi:hypothetical protein
MAIGIGGVKKSAFIRGGKEIKINLNFKLIL